MCAYMCCLSTVFIYFLLHHCNSKNQIASLQAVWDMLHVWAWRHGHRAGLYWLLREEAISVSLCLSLSLFLSLPLSLSLSLALSLSLLLPLSLSLSLSLDLSLSIHRSLSLSYFSSSPSPSLYSEGLFTKLFPTHPHTRMQTHSNTYPKA